MGDAVPIWSHRSYEAPSVELPKSWYEVSSVLGLAPAGFPRHFSFQRTKKSGEWRTMVWLTFSSKLSVNVSLQFDMWPKNFREAREYARGFASQHGFSFRERRHRDVWK